MINRYGMRKAWGGPLTGELAEHIAPDALLDNLIKNFDPYNVTETGGKGDLAKAKAEMKLSKYDKNHDGVCDASACKNLFTITGAKAVEEAFLPVLEQSLKGIGITLKDQVLKDAYTPIGEPRKNIPFSTRPGWGKDYSDPYAFFGANFDGRGLIPEGNTNRGLVGITGATGQEARRQGQRERHPERQQGPRRMPADPRREALHLLRGARQEALHGRRSVGAVAVGRLRQPDLEERHAVGLRPVPRDDRIRPRGGQVI